MPDITALGELLIDFTPIPGQPPRYIQNPGGAPANVLSAAAAQGASCALIGKVGDDPFGDFLISAASGRGIDCSAVCRDAKVPTTLAFVCLSPDGDRSFRFYRDPGADVMLTPEDVPEALIRQSRIFHFGSLSLTDEPARAATQFAVAQARQSGILVSYDPNYRAPLWRSEAEARQWMRWPLDQVDILKVSAEELPLLADTDDIEEGSRRLAALGIRLVLVSMGAEGACCRRGDLFFHRPAYPVQAVDTTGSGDAFMGTILAGVRNLDRAGLETLDEDFLTALVARANAAGGLTATRRGAIAVMPTAEELDAFMG